MNVDDGYNNDLISFEIVLIKNNKHSIVCKNMFSTLKFDFIFHLFICTGFSVVYNCVQLHKFISHLIIKERKWICKIASDLIIQKSASIVL